MKKNKIIKKIVIVIAILFFIGVIALVISQLYNDHLIKVEEARRKKSYLSNDIKTTLYKNDSGFPTAYLDCSSTRNFSDYRGQITLKIDNPSSIYSGDEIKCKLRIDTPDLKADELYYAIEFGKNLNLWDIEKPYYTTIIEKETNEEDVVSYWYDPTYYDVVEDEQTNTKIVYAHDMFEDASTSMESLLSYNIRNNADEGVTSLSIYVRNIVIKTKDGKYYSLDNIEKKFSISSEKYYITDSGNVSVEYPGYGKVADEYFCQTSYCEYINKITNNKYLFFDDGYLMYDSVSKKSESLNKYLNNYTSINQVVLNSINQVDGVLLSKKSLSSDDMMSWAYYNAGNDSFIYLPDIGKNNSYYRIVVGGKIVFLESFKEDVDDEITGVFYDEKGELISSSGTLYKTKDNIYIVSYGNKNIITKYDSNFNGISKYETSNWIGLFDSDSDDYLYEITNNTINVLDSDFKQVASIPFKYGKKQYTVDLENGELNIQIVEKPKQITNALYSFDKNKKTILEDINTVELSDD